MPVVARKTWRTLEPYHGVDLLRARATRRYAALGVTDRMMGYFGSRAAPMGPCPADVVVATFFNFHPKLVTTASRRCGTSRHRTSSLDARLARAPTRCCGAILGDAVDSPRWRKPQRSRAAPPRPAPRGTSPVRRTCLARRGPTSRTSCCGTRSRCLREFRGDGHIAAMAAEGLDGCEALVTHAASGDVPRPRSGLAPVAGRRLERRGRAPALTRLDHEGGSSSRIPAASAANGSRRARTSSRCVRGKCSARTTARAPRIGASMEPGDRRLRRIRAPVNDYPTSLLRSRAPSAVT